MQPRNHLVIIKTNPVTSAVRNTSCSRGWLRTFVECMFGMITVLSFVLIVSLSIKSNNIPSSPARVRCNIQGCTVDCDYSSVVYTDELQDEIDAALMKIETVCKYRYLNIQNLIFHDSTLPRQWLIRLKSSVYSLAIQGGNLRYIAPDAFATMFGSYIHRLMLKDVILLEWDPSTLYGLSRLEELIIDDCVLNDISHSALQHVSFTLNRMTIKSSENWNPQNLTGSSYLPLLHAVKFSYNNFGSILGRQTFTQITHCQILYLDYCKITTIDSHTFDWFTELRILYLNNNYLVTLPVGLFNNIINVINHTHFLTSTQINLQDNNWMCSCNQTELLRLMAAGLLSTDPLCYYSEGLTVISITQLEIACREQSLPRIRTRDSSNYINANGSCHKNDYQIDETKFLSPLGSHSCSSSIFPRLSRSIRERGERNRLDSQRKTELLSPTFALGVNNNLFVEVLSNTSENQIGFGLVWFQSRCPSEIYCINTLPKYLRLYSMDEQSSYTFCPIRIKSGTVEDHQCISYSKESEPSNSILKLLWLFLLISGIIFLALGATGVYVLIQKYPSLLKGNKRILFVKHKTVDALILPPKVPLRPDLIDENVKSTAKHQEKEIFTVSSSNAATPKDFLRMMSMRSTKSSTPSYISALEPTESQLKEWRLKHLDGLPSDASDEISLCFSTPCSYYSDDSSIYYSFGENSYNCKSTNQTDFNYVRL